MGLTVDIYKNGHGYDCTNNGISSKVRELCLVNVKGPSEPNANAPAAMLVRGHQNTMKIVPAARTESGAWGIASGWWMMGGNYGATSDSRFSAAVEMELGHSFYGAVAIHDRQE